MTYRHKGKEFTNGNSKETYKDNPINIEIDKRYTLLVAVCMNCTKIIRFKELLKHFTDLMCCPDCQTFNFRIKSIRYSKRQIKAMSEDIQIIKSKKVIVPNS